MLTENDFTPTKHGTINDDRDGDNYCLAVSGLADMKREYESLLIGEARLWLLLRGQHDAGWWNKQRARLKHTRGTIFAKRLQATMRQLRRRGDTKGQR